MLSRIKKKIWRTNSEIEGHAEDQYEMQKQNFHKWFHEDYQSAKEIMKFFKIFWFGLDKTYKY